MPKTNSSSIAVIDIESVADIDPAQLKAMIGKWEPPKNWKDPDKISAKRDKDISDMIDKAALNARTGRVVIVGVALRDINIESGGWEYQVLVDRVKDEKRLLEALDDVLYEASVLNLVTFNGRKFDIPFLAMRSMAHKLALRYRWPAGYHKLHIDMFDIFGKEGSLDAWIMGILGRSKTISGGQVAKLLEAEQYDEAAEHCLQDIKDTAELFDLYKDAVDLHRK